MPKILMIAYHFSPDSSVGAVRSVKFASYLPHFGWKPYILTVDTRYYAIKEPAENKIDFDIYRTSKWLTLDDIYLRLKKIIMRRKKANPNSQEVHSELESPANEPMGQKRPLWKRIIGSLSNTPDEHIGWLFPAAIKAIRLIRENDIDIIYSSGPPFTCHLIALTAKLFTGRKWVVDFRDPWTMGNRLYDHFNALSLWVEKHLEKAVISRADCVITVTPSITNQFKNKYQLADSKCTTIFNGYDDEDFAGRVKQYKGSDAPLTFLHAGTLYMGRDPSTFLEAISELIKDGLLAKNKIRVNFVGINDLGDLRMKKMIEFLDLADVVCISEPVPRDKYFDMIVNADVLVTMQSDLARSQIPGKTFEYLATGNLILALVSSGATSELLSEFDNALVADPHDKNGIKDCILKLSRGWIIDPERLEKGKLKLKELTRERQTQEFASILDKMK